MSSPVPVVTVATLAAGGATESQCVVCECPLLSHSIPDTDPMAAALTSAVLSGVAAAHFCCCYQGDVVGCCGAVSSTSESCGELLP